MRDFLITWFYAEKKEDESFYPSVGGNTSSPEYQKVYWKCVYDFYCTAQITQDRGSNINYLFFTNVPNIPTNIDGIDIKKFFEDNNIKVERIELTYQTPKDWYGAWRNQFYLFNILEFLNENYTGNFLILDSDIFITKDLTPIFEDIQNKKIISYDYGYSDEELINGISISQMRQLYLKFKSVYNIEERGENLRYKCGELIALSSDVIPDVLKCYYNLWKFNYSLYENNLPKLNEEAHFLSLIYHYLGYNESYANRYIKRMWTAIKFDNIEVGDEDITLWHLPAEKKYAFNSAFEFLNVELSKYEYINFLKKMLHIPGNRLLRKLRMIKLKVYEKSKYFTCT